MSAPLDRLVRVAEVAAMLGYSCVATFRRRRAALEARGFPKPLIGQCYDPLAIKAWRLSQMDPKLRAVIEGAVKTGDSAAVEIDWETALAANAEQLAGTVQ